MSLPDLGSASFWSAGNLLQPIRNTSLTWIVTRHQYGISAPVPEASFRRRPCWGQYNRISMKIQFSSQRREMLLFLTTNMAAVTSRANQQYRLFSQATVQNFLTRLELKISPETGEQTTGGERGTSTENRKNEKWDMVSFFPFFRVPVPRDRSQFPFLSSSVFTTSWDEEVGESRKGGKKRRARRISRIVLSNEAIVWLI